MRFPIVKRLARGLLIGASLTGVVLMTAGTSAETVTSQETARSLRHTLERLPYYGVFDYMSFQVERGVVTLNGLCCQEITVTNKARLCCERERGTGDQRP